MSRRTTIVSKPPRADAQRNYRRLVEVAAKFFTEKGPEAPMEEVARRARVGIGTLYRHFPTRYDLLETVYAKQIEALIGRAQELKDSLPPGPALFAWLQAEAEHMMTYRALKVCLQSRPDGTKFGANWKDRLIAAGSELLEAAEKAGAVRKGLDGNDLLHLVHGITLAAEKAPDSARQAKLLIGVMTDGLRSAT
ncbi:MAG: TetR/AcrR family transcriptional regulator [Spirochaetia bacterium]|jgi:AcrR family transcriptional regulator